MARIKPSGNNDNDEHDQYNGHNDNEQVDEMSDKYTVHTGHACFRPSRVP